MKGRAAQPGSADVAKHERGLPVLYRFDCPPGGYELDTVVALRASHVRTGRLREIDHRAGAQYLTLLQHCLCLLKKIPTRVRRF